MMRYNRLEKENSQPDNVNGLLSKRMSLPGGMDKQPPVSTKHDKVTPLPPIGDTLKISQDVEEDENEEKKVRLKLIHIQLE